MMAFFIPLFLFLGGLLYDFFRLKLLGQTSFILLAVYFVLKFIFSHLDFFVKEERVRRD